MNYSGEQVLNQCLDRTDPNNPALRTTGGGGGGGGGSITLLPGDTLSSSGAQSRVTVGTSSTQVAAANSSRYELILANTGTKDAWINSDAAATNQHLPLPAGSERRFTGGLAKRQWFSIAAAAGGEILPFFGVQ